MTNILQPSDSDRATLYAIAWDIVKRHVDASDRPYTPEEIGALVAHTCSRIIVDGGGAKLEDEALRQK
jgi:hypothetical protein